MDRKARFRLIVEDLGSSEAATDFDEARKLLSLVLNRVEDLHSGVPYRPENWMQDGRLYPPLDDSERPSAHSEVRVFRTRGHLVQFAHNGAIRIVNANSGHVVLDKAGADGKRSPF